MLILLFGQRFLNLLKSIVSDFPCFEVCMISHQAQNVKCGSEFMKTQQFRKTQLSVPHC